MKSKVLPYLNRRGKRCACNTDRAPFVECPLTAPKLVHDYHCKGCRYCAIIEADGVHCDYIERSASEARKIADEQLPDY